MQNITNHIKSNRCFTTIGLSALISLFLLTLTILLPLDWSEDTTEAVTGSPILSETSLTMTSTSNIASVDLSVNNSNGTFATSDSNNQIKFNISTTNYTGYTLSIKGNDNNRQLVNITNSNIKLNSIGSTINYDTFNSNDSYNNTWGYLPSKLNSSANTNYLPAPTTTASTLDKTTTANSTANIYTIGIGARASYTTPAGEYTGTYILTVVANNVSYNISFADNSGDTGGTDGTSSVANLPSNLSGSSSLSSLTLPSTIPTRTGYTFVGWCSVETTNSGTACGGDTYNAGSTYYFDEEDSNIVTLYAIWELNSYTVTVSFSNSTSVSFVANGYTTQTATPSSTTVSLYYNVPYTITMGFASNYEFSGWTTTTNGTLASTSTNPTTYTVTGTATLTATGKSSVIYIQDFTKSMCSSQATSSAVTVTDRRDNKTYMVRYINGLCWMTQNLSFNGTTLKTATTNVTSNKSISYSSLSLGNSYTTPDIYESNITSRGFYYNYVAATAGTITGKDNSSEATQDICPARWRLPSYTEFTTTASFKNAFSPVYSGLFQSGSFFSETGNWWSSTYSTGTDRRTLRYSSNGNLSIYSLDRGYGASIRCVRSS